MTWHSRLGTERQRPITKLEALIAGATVAGILIIVGVVLTFGG